MRLEAPPLVSRPPVGRSIVEGLLVLLARTRRVGLCFHLLVGLVLVKLWAGMRRLTGGLHGCGFEFGKCRFSDVFRCVVTRSISLTNEDC